GARGMRRFASGAAGRERPGVLLDDGRRLDVAAFGADYDESFFGADGVSALRTWLASHADSSPVVSDAWRLGAPFCRRSKIVGIGLNFRDHAVESGMDIPREPVIFFKATSSIAGPNDPVVIPRGGSNPAW